MRNTVPRQANILSSSSVALTVSALPFYLSRHVVRELLSSVSATDVRTETHLSSSTIIYYLSLVLSTWI